MTRTQSTAAFSQELAGGSSTNNLVSIASGRVRKAIDESSNRWSDEVADRLQALIRLLPGWDGYQGRPVSFVNANFAFQMLNSVCGPEARAPQIVPGSAGDLQIEWHTLRGDIELHVKGPTNVHAWRALTGGDPAGEELNLTVDFAIVAQWVSEVTEASFAAATAA